MTTHILANVVFFTVAIGVAFQVFTVARLGHRIAARRLTALSKQSPSTKSPRPAPARRVARRRCRDYRVALASGRG
jgi:hypothetical protein